MRSARSEIERIARAIDGIEHRRSALLAQLAELDEQAAGYVRRRELLEELVFVEEGTPTAAVASKARASAARTVRGGELRRVAGRLLWVMQGAQEIHYREWFERLTAEGFAVTGKDPAASFLTNVRDSAAVQRASKPGYYRLDSSSVDRAAQQASETRAELADVERSLERTYADPARSRGIEELRGHRDKLKQRLKRVEGTLAELQYIFAEEAQVDAPAGGVTPALAA
ncbi:MAG TPA: hypothetical protein VGL37_09950 [Solirubrobacteraceae bacterium]